jgi:DNA-binding PadR family transcriptional regulator
MYNRELLKGTLNTMVLKLLADHGKMYGYEIAQKVKELSHDKILLKDGSLYPALHKLMNDGILSYEEEYIGKRVRKYYYLTTIGKEHQKKTILELKDFLQTLASVFEQDLKLTIA